jgi:cell division protein FtsB
MSDKKKWGSTVLGWFVVPNEGDETPSVSQADGSAEASPETQAAGESPSLAASAFSGAIPDAPGGKIDFNAVFEAAGIDPDAQGRVSKAAELLGALPAGTEPAVKKQIVEASLKAFGVPIEKIIETGAQEIQTLESYIQQKASETQAQIATTQDRITKFDEEIRRMRGEMDVRVAEQKTIMTGCNQKKLDIQRVLEFFGQEAVARVVRDSPKLVEPTPPK